jgi:hypothetical protein
MPKAVRGATAKSLLKLTWDYPSYTPPPQKQSEGTVAKVERRALTQQEALAVIAGKDPRPLLVLRECAVCNGTDDALLSPGADNERTFLLSRWFHCVKLPQDVLQADHPFHSLFAGEDPEHMFFSARDGAGRMPLESEGSRAELWDVMTSVLAAQYASSPQKALKEVLASLDELDRTDLEIGRLEQRLEELLEKEGQDGKHVVKIRAQIGELQAELRNQMAEFERRAHLELKSGEPTAAR